MVDGWNRWSLPDFMTIRSKWMYASDGKGMVLNDDDVHIWRANLQSDAISLVRSQLVLNDAELDKANRQYFDRDRIRSIMEGIYGISCLNILLYKQPRFNLTIPIRANPLLIRHKILRA